jgi:hypothetical protein
MFNVNQRGRNLSMSEYSLGRVDLRARLVSPPERVPRPEVRAAPTHAGAPPTWPTPTPPPIEHRRAAAADSFYQTPAA